MKTIVRSFTINEDNSLFLKELSVKLKKENNKNTESKIVNNLIELTKKNKSIITKIKEK